MSTIPDQLYERLANARITRADGAALIGLIDAIQRSVRLAEQAAELAGSDLYRQACWRVGVWSHVAEQYRDLVGGAR
ncbi:MAG: hypothetical protein ACRDTH_14825 [Pseudonocardiaceae bacterium]